MLAGLNLRLREDFVDPVPRKTGPPGGATIRAMKQALRRRGKLAAIAVLTLTSAISVLRAQNIDFAAIELQTVKLADGLYVLMGGAAQGNIVVSAGSDGMFLVDSMYGPMHQKIMDALAKIGRSRFATSSTPTFMAITPAATKRWPGSER